MILAWIRDHLKKMHEIKEKWKKISEKIFENKEQNKTNGCAIMYVCVPVYRWAICDDLNEPYSSLPANLLYWRPSYSQYRPAYDRFDNDDERSLEMWDTRRHRSFQATLGIDASDFRQYLPISYASIRAASASLAAMGQLIRMEKYCLTSQGSICTSKHTLQQKWHKTKRNEKKEEQKCKPRDRIEMQITRQQQS